MHSHAPLPSSSSSSSSSSGGGGSGGGGAAAGAGTTPAGLEESDSNSAVQQFSYHSKAHQHERQLTIVRREPGWTPSLSDIDWTDKFMGDLELLRDQVVSGAVMVPAAGVCVYSESDGRGAPRGARHGVDGGDDDDDHHNDGGDYDGEGNGNHGVRGGAYYQIDDREAKSSVVLQGSLVKNPVVKSGVAAMAMNGLQRFMDHFKRSKERWFVMSKATTACPATLTYFKDSTMTDLKGSFVLDHTWQVGEIPNDLLTFTLYNGDLGVNLVAKKIREKKAWTQALRAALKTARCAYTHRLYKESRFALVFQLSKSMGESPTNAQSRQLRNTLHRNQLNTPMRDLLARAMVCATCKGPFARKRRSLFGSAKAAVSRHCCVFCKVVMCNECSYMAPDVAQFEDDDDALSGVEGMRKSNRTFNQICRDCNFLWNALPRAELQEVLEIERQAEQEAIRKHQEKKRIEQAMQEQLEMQSRSNAAYEEALTAMQRATEEQMEMLDNSNLNDSRDRSSSDTKEQQELDISTIMAREMSQYPDDLKELFASFDAGTPKVSGKGSGAGSPGGSPTHGGGHDNDDGSSDHHGVSSGEEFPPPLPPPSAKPPLKHAPEENSRLPAQKSQPVRRRSSEDAARPPPLAIAGAAKSADRLSAHVNGEQETLHEHEADERRRRFSSRSRSSSSHSGSAGFAGSSLGSSRHDVLGEMGREIFGSPGTDPAIATSPLSHPQGLPKHLASVVDVAVKQKQAEQQKELARQRIQEARRKREASRERREAALAEDSGAESDTVGFMGLPRNILHRPRGVDALRKSVDHF